MKYIREASDIHLDFDTSRFHKTRVYDPGEPVPTCEMDLLWYPEPMEGDDETCMIVAGDLWRGRRFLKMKHPYTKRSWIEMMADQFKYVVFVLGNHDYWEANLDFEAGRVKKKLTEMGLSDKVFLLDNDSVVLDQVKFVGGPLWTSFNNADPLVMLNATSTMNDYKYIRSTADYKHVHPREILRDHKITRDFIFENAKKDSPDQRLVVVTHHAPSYQSINPKYRTGRGGSNFYYYSDFDEDIAETDIELWFHGHCHCTSDYTINNTRVICNPRGYERYEYTQWNPQLRIEL